MNAEKIKKLQQNAQQVRTGGKVGLLYVFTSLRSQWSKMFV